MSSAALTSLGILKVNFDQGRNFYDQFVPFAAYAGAHTQGNHISLPEIQSYIREEFDLFLPEYPLHTIIRRAAHNGYFNEQENTYVVNYAAVEQLGVDRVRQRVSDSFSTVIERLRLHVRERYGHDWTADEAISAVTTYLDSHDVDVLFDEVEKPILPEADRAPEAYAFYLSSFVDEARRREPDIFEAFVDIVKGHMLANVIYYPNFDQIESGFDGTEIYFDGPIVLAALGYSGSIRQDPITEMIDLLYKAGAQLSCFRHSVEEVEEILMSCSEALARGANTNFYSPAFEELLSMGMSRSDIWRESQHVPDRLTDFKVNIKRAPSPGREDPADVKLLEELIRDDPNLYYRRSKARERDVQSLASIVRLRKGRPCGSLERCRAVFVSDNRALVRIADDYIDEILVSDSAPIAVHEATMTNHVWLKNPIDAPELPRQRIIADCAAVLEPDDGLWDRYLDEIEGLRDEGTIDENEYVLLRSEPAKRRLVEVTANREEAFVAGQYPDILEHAKEDAVAAERAIIEEERQERKEVERDLREEKKWRFETRANIRRTARVVAHRVTQVVALGLGLGVTAGGIAIAFDYELSSIPSPYREALGWAITLVPVLSALDLALGVISGYRVRRLFRKWEGQLERFIERKLTGWFLASG